MQLGFVTAILPDQTLEQVADFASATSYECIEVMCWPQSKAERRYAGVTHIDVTRFRKSDARQIRDVIEERGIAISSLGYYPNPLAPQETESKAAVEHIKAVIKASELLGLGRMTTFVGRDWRLSVQDNWKRFRKVWKPLIKFAEGHGVRVGIENCPMLFTEDEWPGGKNLAISPAIWERMFDEIPSDHFGLNYDPSHLVWMQMDYIQPLWDFADRLVHVHAKDVRVDRHRLDRVGILAHPLEYHSPKLPGLGEVNWGRFFSVLADTGYQGPVCVEVEDRAYEDSLESRQAALRQSATYLRNFMPH